MIHTCLTTVLGIEHPIIQGGMGTGTDHRLISAVTNAGGLGILGASYLSAEALEREIAAIGEATTGPFGINHLLFFVDEECLEVSLAARPKVISAAWASAETDLGSYVERAHKAGALFMYQVPSLREAQRAVDAGVDIVVAQGSEAGGHVGQQSTFPLVRQVARAVQTIPVVAAGGVVDGAGLAAALALGADGVLLGSRFVASQESTMPDSYKEAIVRSDGTDTLLTDIPDIALGRTWPGALGRVVRNRFVERWIGRETELRLQGRRIGDEMMAARGRGDVAEMHMQVGQSGGLIDAVEPAAVIVNRIVAEAEAVIADRLLVAADRSCPQERTTREGTRHG